MYLAFLLGVIFGLVAGATMMYCYFWLQNNQK